MKMIDLTLLENEKTITFCFSTNLAFGDNWFQDGNSNNKGWKVKESRDEIIKKIKHATIIVIG